MENHTEQRFKVEGMSCQHCVAAITRAIRALDPAAGVEVDLAACLVRVNSRLSEDTVLRILTEEGYPVSA